MLGVRAGYNKVHVEPLLLAEWDLNKTRLKESLSHDRNDTRYKGRDMLHLWVVECVAVHLLSALYSTVQYDTIFAAQSQHDLEFRIVFSFLFFLCLLQYKRITSIEYSTCEPCLVSTGEA